MSEQATRPRGAVGVVLLSPGTLEVDEMRPLRALARALAEASGYGAVELAHVRYMPPGLLEAVATLVAGGVEQVFVVPLLLVRDRDAREHVPALVEAARHRHPAVRIEVTATLAESPGLVGAIQALLPEVSARPGPAEVEHAENQDQGG